MRHSSRFGAMGQGKTYGLASCALMFTGTSCRLPGPRNQITDLRKPMSQTLGMPKPTWARRITYWLEWVFQ